MTLPTEKYDVRDQRDGSVKFTAKIRCAPGEFPSVKLGLAVKWGFSNRKNLAGANLAGANLDGANLAGARIVERPIRRLVAIVPRLIEPYFFYAFEMDDDGIVWINAGCQWRTVPNYHEHIAHDYPETLKAAETTDILNFITARAAALGAKIDG